MDRKRVITGNWKMYKTIEEAKDFLAGLIPVVASSTSKVCLAVPFTCLYPLAEQAQDSAVIIGAQNMNDSTEGAFTGEVAGRMLKEAGAQFVLLGHSERRRLYKEDNSFINRKIKRAIESNLHPVLCIGETQEEREAGQTQEVIRQQLTECLQDLNEEQLKNLIVAYEPVWAIGTGLSATPEMAQEAHQFCRAVLAELMSLEFANQIIIQYGGSANPKNAKELLDQPDIDGLLIGGASLSLESFSQIVNDSNQQL